MLTIALTARALGLTPARIRQIRDAGHFPGAVEPLGSGRGYLIPQADIDAYLAKKSAGEVGIIGWRKGKPRKELGKPSKKSRKKSAAKSR